MNDNTALQFADNIVLLLQHEVITKEEAREMLGLNKEKE